MPRTAKQTLAYMVKWFSTRVPRPFDVDKAVFSTNGSGKPGYSQNIKSDLYLIPYTKKNSK